jgi:predicted MFS family arabinose efflux permease
MHERKWWWVLLGLSLGPAVSNGFARFAYGLLLPSMQQDLGWNYTVAGSINTANAIGYLVGALLALTLVRQIGAARMFIGGMVVTTIALLCSGFTRDIGWLSVWRILAGIGSAPVFITGGALAALIFREDPRKSALAVAVYFGGGGLGMLMTGISIPLLLEWVGPQAWTSAWIILGICTALMLWPSIAAAKAVAAPAAAGEHEHRQGLQIAGILPALLGYFAFGLGYFVYMTFLVAWMREQGEGVWLVVVTWSLLGIMVMASPFLWRGVMAASKGGVAQALTLTCTGLGTLMPLLVAGSAGMLISAVLFGLAFFMVPTSLTNFSRKNYPQSQWSAAVALFTTVFAIGQIIGPAAAGWVADRASSLAPGMAAAGVVLLVGAVISLLQQPLAARAER